MSRLNDAIRKSGIKKGFIAQELRVNPATVTAWCKSGRVPDDEMKRRLAKMLGLSVGYLFFDENGRRAETENRKESA